MLVTVAMVAWTVASRPLVADEPAGGQNAERPRAASDASAAGAARQATDRPTASIWDGVYTEAQAKRGEELYPGPCGRCHGRRLDGAPDDPDMIPTPPIAGPKFLREWDGQSLGTLFAYLRSTMPENNPGFLAEQEYADLIAYMLLVTGAPAGRAPLRPDSAALATIEIRKDGSSAEAGEAGAAPSP